MVNILALINRLLRWLMNPAGVKPELVEIEPGTVMNFWVPTKKTNKSKPVLVFLHGFAGNAILTWLFQVIGFARAYDVYMPDLIFFGDSTTDRPERSVEFQAKCVAKGLKILGVEKRFVLIGFSYGTAVGLTMAKLYPDLVEAMVATAFPLALTESLSRGSLERIGFKTWSEYLIPNSTNGVKVLLKIATHKLPPVPDWLYRHYLEEMIIHRKEREELLDALTVADENFTITPYTQKIHIIWGKSDHLFDTQIAYQLKEQLGGKASLDLMEKTGHLATLEHPFLYNKCISNFLNSLYLQNSP